ncbi:MAG TPA: hypothetical protein VMT21_03960 [Gemmatimonadales bacterium]|nr:hypothetical protein [Gemmatimonadales bacterium]
MIRDLFGASSIYSALRAGLDRETVRQRGIAHRVANAQAELAGDAAAAGTAVGPGAAAAQTDLERSMVDLADTQLRFDATSVLLQKAYGQFRSALKND